jgi:hypothetical protein
MQNNENEINAKELSFTLVHASGETSQIKVGRKAKYMIPYMIKSCLRATSWTSVDYQGLRIDNEKSEQDQSVNVLVATNGMRIIF